LASSTPNYGFETGVVTDDFIEPSHHNRLADTVDRALGEFLTHVIAAGAQDGWEIELTKEVSAGRGLISACWCQTGAAQAIEQLTNDAVNHVYGVLDETSAPEGTAQFVAQVAPPGPGGSILLGTIELDAGGAVVTIDNDAPGVQRSCHRLAVETLVGSGVVQGVPGGATVVACVSHAAIGEFRVPGDLRVDSDTPLTEWEVAQHHRGDEFTIRVTNLSSYPVDFAYTWSREGIIK